jgi:hypothetical protein
MTDVSGFVVTLLCYRKMHIIGVKGCDYLLPNVLFPMETMNGTLCLHQPIFLLRCVQQLSCIIEVRG